MAKDGPKAKPMKGPVADPNLQRVEVEKPAAPSPSLAREPRIKEDRKYIFKSLNEKQLDTLKMSFPPQAKTIFLLVNPENQVIEISEKDLFDLINLHADKLKTKQSPWRIFQYYRPKLISYGFLRFE